MKKQYSYLFEILIGIAIILFINVMWFGSNMGFIGVPISPYWLVVIFVAARYGSFPGFVAGLSCSAALLISVSYNAAIEQQVEFAAIPMRQIQLSAFFILIGFLLGEERSRVNLTLRKWQEKYNRLRNEFEALAMEHVALKNVNTELQGRVLGQTETVNTIYDAAKALVTLRTDQLYPSIVHLIKRIVDPEKLSLYIWDGEKYILKGHSGWDQRIEQRKVLDTNPDIIKKAIADNAVTTVVDVFKTNNLKWKEGEEPCIVVPLFFGDQMDVPAGFILIDEISFLKFSPDTLKFLKSLADWISKSLDNAEAATMARRKDLYDEDLKIFNFNYAVRKLKDELLTVQVVGRPTSLLFIKARDIEQLDPAAKKKVQKDLLSVVAKTLRSSDTVAEYSSPDTFLAILPGSDKTGATIVENRIREQIGKIGLKSFKDEGKLLDVVMSSRVMGPELKDVNAILAAE